MAALFKKVFFTSFLSLSILLGAAVTSPPKGTDIYLADFGINKNEIVPGPPVNITNREGYDNQPSFFPDGGSLFYTSIREDNQADVYQYNIQNGETQRVTNTPESEFSPTVMPDGKFFSTVRVEKDSMQRLWKFPLNGGEPSVILADIIPVGYHCWANQDTLALFILGEHNTLQINNLKTGKLDVIAGDIGRSLHKIPYKNSISFVRKIGDKKLVVNQLNLENGKVTPIIKLSDNNEDLAWLPDGTLIRGKGAKLYKFRPGNDKSFKQIADYSSFGIKEILRIAVSPKGNKIAFVSDI